MKKTIWDLRRNIKIVSVILILSLFFSLLLGEGAVEAGILRVGGADRYETSAFTSGDVYPSAGTVIIARGDPAGHFADGLAASVLAGVLDAPVLLTTPGALPGAIKQEIKRLGATKAYLLGGTEAIADGVDKTLRDMGLVVTRIGGKDRYDTAAKIAKEASDRGFTQKNAFIVNGSAPADSLVAGSAAFRSGIPILLATRDSIPDETKNMLKSLGISQVYIVGGKAVVSSSVESALAGLTTVKKRLAGPDRYGTSVRVAEEFFPGEGDALLVSGLDENLADSIGACIYKLPILYVKRETLPEAVQNFLKGSLRYGSTVRIMGGTAAVGRSVESAVNSLLAGAEGEDSVTYKVRDVTITTDPADVSSLDNSAQVEVTLFTPTAGARIYYTLDGSNPTTASTLYSNPFNLTTDIPTGETVTVKAIGVKAGYIRSAIAVKEVVFEAKSCTVTLDAQGGTVDPGAIEVAYGTPYGELPVPNRAGYSFNGWFTAAVGGDQVTGDTVMNNPDDHTLYAQWTANTYTLSFDSQGGTPLPAAQAVTYGSAYGSLPVVSKEGHTFLGWFTSFSGDTEVTAASLVETAGDHTLYARWTANTYTLSFDSQGGTPSPPAQTVTYGSAYGSLPVVSKEGHTFLGWFTSSSGGTEVTAASLVETAGDHSLYARWMANAYTLSFDSQGGTPTPAAQTVTYGSAYGSLPVVSREGYTFLGWFTASSGGTEVTAASLVEIAGDHSLYARWAASYTITFNSNGGSPVDPITQAYGTPVTPPPDPIKGGHTFEGWNPALPATMPAYDLTVTAQWSGEAVTVTFDPQGGTVNPTTKTVYYGAPYGELPIPTRTGYTFDGWHQSGSGTLVTAEDKVWNGGNHTLHAYWKANTYRVTPDYQGGTISGPWMPYLDVKYGEPYGDNLPNATRFGYTFNGWFTDPTGGTQVTSETIMNRASDHNIYAQWTAKPLILTKPEGTVNQIAATEGSWEGDMDFNFKGGYLGWWISNGDYWLRIPEPHPYRLNAISLIKIDNKTLRASGSFSIGESGEYGPVTVTVEVRYRTAGNDEIGATFYVTVVKAQDATAQYIVSLP